MRNAVVGVIGTRAQLGAFASLGLDAAAIQRETGLTDQELADPDRLLPASRQYAIWEAAERRWNRPGLGLETGAAVPIGAYEVLDYLALSAATLGEGLQDLANYLALATRTAAYRISNEPPFVVCEMVWNIAPEGVMLHLRDYSQAVFAARARAASGVVPAYVEVCPPALAPLALYERVFRAPVRLGAGRSALVFSMESWGTPTLRRDPHLQRMLRRHADLLLDRASGPVQDDMADRVRAELLQRTRVGLPSLTSVSRGLGVGPRTVQRQLKAEGVSFAELVDEVRATLAREYLRDPEVTISEVAYLLGFSELSAFSRAFRRWTGRSPQAFRSGAGA